MYFIAISKNNVFIIVNSMCQHEHKVINKVHKIICGEQTKKAILHLQVSSHIYV